MGLKALALNVLAETQSVPRGVPAGQSVGTVDVVAGECEITWPPASVEAERRFGQVHARLFPFLKKGALVWSPFGVGQLVQCFADWCVLKIEGREIRVRTESARLVM